MSLTLDAKKAIVEEVNSIATEAPSAIAAEYIGLTVIEMTELRNAAREAGVYLKVVRNTLARRALENTQFECMRDNLVGPLLLVFSNDEPGNVRAGANQPFHRNLPNRLRCIDHSRARSIHVGHVFLYTRDRGLCIDRPRCS